MTLEYLQYAIGEIALKNNLVNWYGAGGSLYELNGNTIKDYPLVYMSATGEHTVFENVTRYTLTIFYIDRLTDDLSNETNVASVAVETLKNLYRQIPMISWVDNIQEDPRIRLFTETERLDDRCAGAYMTVWVDVLNPSTCPVYFDETGFPLGNWIPDGITQNVLDNLASKPWVIEQIAKMEKIDPSVVEALISDLANYTQTKDFATINGDKITDGGNFELATKEEKENLQDQIDGNADDIHDLDVRVTDLENQSVDWATSADTQDLQRQIDVHTDQISAITQNYATTAVTNSLQNQITAITADLSNYATTAVTDSISRVNDRQDDDINALSGRTNDLQNQITAITNNYATTAVTNDLQDQITAITNNYATSAVTEDLQDQIDNLSGVTAGKQDALTAGNLISISGNTIKVQKLFVLDDLNNVAKVNEILDAIPANSDGQVGVLYNRVWYTCSNNVYYEDPHNAYLDGLYSNYMLLDQIELHLLHLVYGQGATHTSSVIFDGADIQNLRNTKQDVLVDSGATQNIKTINGQSIIGQGDIQTPNSQYNAGANISIDTGNTISVEGVILPAPGSPNTIACIWSGSQAQYEAIGAGNYHNDWLYFIDRT